MVSYPAVITFVLKGAKGDSVWEDSDIAGHSQTRTHNWTLPLTACLLMLRNSPRIEWHSVMYIAQLKDNIYVHIKAEKR